MLRLGAPFVATLLVVLVVGACGQSDGDDASSQPTTSASSQVGDTAGLDVAALPGATAKLDPAPDFEFTIYQGDEHIFGSGNLNLSSLIGRPLVLNFWAGLCPPCQAEMPDIQEFYHEFNDRVSVFGLDIGPFTGLGSNQSGKELIDALNIVYPVGTTADASVGRKYALLGMPTTIFITADGKIFRSWGGLLNKEKLVEITEDMLALTLSATAGAHSGEGS